MPQTYMRTRADSSYIRCMPQGRYLFVSDLHLAASAPAATALFVDFLRTEARDCAALYILGDLFESWIGDDDDDPIRRTVCEALHALTAGGCLLYTSPS